MDRSHTVYDGDKIIEQYMEDFTWSMVRNERQGVLEMSDYMFFSDNAGSRMERLQTIFERFTAELRFSK